MATGEISAEPRLDKDRHVKYWKRCIKTFLPSQYTSNESNRMYLAYFIVSALEMLDVLDSTITAEERAGYIEWIYHCQHPTGGFRMWPGTDFNERANAENAKWDPAHVPATYFALTTLVTLGDSLQRVEHIAALKWLQTMQRSDGSFGETMVDGQLEGGRDPRYGYCAAASRDILRRLCSEDQLANTQDIDIEALARCVLEGQSFDGGIADAALHEPQAGYTFCALGTLDLLGHLSTPEQTRLDRAAVVKWLVDRQTDLLDLELDDGDMLDMSRVASDGIVSDMPPAAISEQIQPASGDTLQPPEVHAAGMNGRPNKTADTCYAWWVAASLHMLGCEVYHKPAVRSYLLLLTQNRFMGGFSKFPDDKYADIYHSFMGLAALSLASTAIERARDGIKAWDATMCVSVEVRMRLSSITGN